MTYVRSLHKQLKSSGAVNQVRPFNIKLNPLYHQWLIRKARIQQIDPTVGPLRNNINRFSSL